MVERSLAVSFVGSMDTIERGLAAFIESLKPDELMVTAHIYDQAARLRSIELVAQVRDNLAKARGEVERALHDATSNVE